MLHTISTDLICAIHVYQLLASLPIVSSPIRLLTFHLLLLFGSHFQNCRRNRTHKSRLQKRINCKSRSIQYYAVGNTRSKTRERGLLGGVCDDCTCTGQVAPRHRLRHYFWAEKKNKKKFLEAPTLFPFHVLHGTVASR